MNPIVFGLAFVLIAAVLVVVGTLLFGGGGAKADGRLDTLVGRNVNRQDSSADTIIKNAMNDLDKKNLLESLIPQALNLNKMVEQADSEWRPGTWVALSCVFGLVGATISTVLVSPFLAPVGGSVLFTFPLIALYLKRGGRLKKFAAQLSDAMELVARALRAGHSLAAGMHVVAEEMPAPISKEFARVYEEQNLGIPIEEALRGMCERVPNMDLRFFVTAVAIQRQTGGDLAEILDRIGYLIRERFKILGQVKALTAEGRLSGVVLLALPVALFLLLLHMKYDYVELLWTDPNGRILSGVGIFMMIVGAYAINKIVDIKV